MSLIFKSFKFTEERVSKKFLLTLKFGDSIFQNPGPTRPNKRRTIDKSI